MSIHLECRNGHKLKAKDKHAGRSTICPKCGVQVSVPNSQPEPRSISDSSVLALLSEQDGGTTTVTRLIPSQTSATKKCPRCKTLISSASVYCPECDCFVS